MIIGNNFRLRISGINLVGETSSGLSFTDNLVEVTKSNTDGFAEYISGVRGGSITFERLYDFNRVLDNGDRVTWSYGDDPVFFGEGIVQSLEVTSQTDEAVTLSGVIEVTGDIIEREGLVNENITINQVAVEIDSEPVQIPTRV